MGANGVYLVSLVKSVPIIINHPARETVFGPKFTETAPPSLTRQMAKDLCLAHYACPPKLIAYKCQNRTSPYHVLFPEPRLLHYVFVCIFYPKDHSKEAYNEVALESIYRLMNGYSVDYASIIVSYMYWVANMTRPTSVHMSATRGWKHASVLNSAESTTLQVPSLKQPTLLALRDSLESLREDYAELCTKVDLIHSSMGLLAKKLDKLIRLTCTIHHGARLAVTFTSSNLDRATHAADRIIHSTSSNPHFI
ncbi:hypothetical protein Cgig2_021012 [Carnegiea gigantea]|uniref:Uncharacterized protein n=1 Tax=Carnegiea gigantea TaxID=171969 RepID=A0A9Q1JXT8_9CARY|nr:hypothetical protein Cgig2_021012 [Carnegiea gigantea]